jgi:mRNA-degrading endonuclease RelE of RelBE toxin-antitoxin system
LRRYVVKYDEAFWQDLKEVIDWYDEFSKEVTDKFLAQFSFAESRIKENPLAFGKVSKMGFRRIKLRRFPYKMYFKVEANTVFVIALIHVARSNRYINKRL